MANGLIIKIICWNNLLKCSYSGINGLKITLSKQYKFWEEGREFLE